MTGKEQASTISRRRVAQGGAWAVPVLLAAQAAPAMAASGPCLTAAEFSFSVFQSVPSLPTEVSPGGPTYYLTSERDLGTFTSTFVNTGATVPGGTATIQLMAPWHVSNATVGYLWETHTVLSATITVGAVTTVLSMTQIAKDQWVVSDNSSWNGFNYTVNDDILSGATITIMWKITAYTDTAPTLLARVASGYTDYRSLAGAKISTTTCDDTHDEAQHLSAAFWLRTPVSDWILIPRHRSGGCCCDRPRAVRGPGRAGPPDRLPGSGGPPRRECRGVRRWRHGIRRCRGVGAAGSGGGADPGATHGFSVIVPPPSHTAPP